MTNEEAKRYWTAKYEAARKWDDPHWEASERKAHRQYVDALKVAIEALSAEAENESCGTCKYFETSHKEYPCSDCTGENSHYVSAEAVQGEWDCMIAYGTDGSNWYEYECSYCGEVVLRPYNFCPNCGTKMFREDGEV